VVAVHDTLAEIGATDKLVVSALNKVDRFARPGRPARLLADFPDAVPISALTGQGIPSLLERVEQELEKAMVPVMVTIPYQRGDLVDLFHKRGLIEMEDHGGDGTRIEGRLPVHLAERYREFEQAVLEGALQ
jgi:GTP-binding protein HflX